MLVMANSIKKFQDMDASSVAKAGGSLIALIASILVASKAAKRLNAVETLSLADNI